MSAIKLPDRNTNTAEITKNTMCFCTFFFQRNRKIISLLTKKGRLRAAACHGETFCMRYVVGVARGKKAEINSSDKIDLLDEIIERAINETSFC